MNLEKSFKLKILAEMIVVFSLMASVKMLADSFHVPGAGSIGIWVGIGCASLFMKWEHKTWKGFGLGLPKGKREWIIQVGLGLGTVILVFLLMGLVMDPLLTSLGLEKAPHAGDRFLFLLGKPWLFLAYLVLIILLGAALGEELLMRGFLLNGLFEFFGKGKSQKAGALILHAVFFGSLHSYQGVHGMITTGSVGLIMGCVYLLAKRKLFPVILAHAIINTISLSAFYLTNGQVN